MKKSTLRSAAAAAALATGLATAAVTTAPAATAAEALAAEASAPTSIGRITTAEQLAEGIQRAVALERSHGGEVATGGNVVGLVAPQADGGAAPRPC